MIDDDLVRRAQVEIARLNQELRAIHEDEERCELRRSRIGAQKAEVQLFISQRNLALRLAAQPDDLNAPKVWIEKLDCGANLVRGEPRKPTPSSPTELTERRKLKPDGLPTIATMIVTALHEAGKASRPVEIAEFVRRRWWANAPIKSITTIAWQMAEEGKLTHHDGRYGLNGAGHNGAGQ